MIVVDNNFLVVVGYYDLDWTFLLLWDGLGLDAGFNLAVNKVLNKGANVIMGELLALIKGEFLVLDSLLNGKCGPFVDFQVQVTSVRSK